MDPVLEQPSPSALALQHLQQQALLEKLHAMGTFPQISCFL